MLVGSNNKTIAPRKNQSKDWLPTLGVSSEAKHPPNYNRLELSEREKKILTLRLGLADGIERTLPSVGRFFRVSSVRIRQIEQRAIKKLKRNNLTQEDRIEGLLEYAKTIGDKKLYKIEERRDSI